MTAIVEGKTKVELLGGAKAIEVGKEAKVWADREDPKTAAKISVGTMQRPKGGTPRNPNAKPVPKNPEPAPAKEPAKTSSFVPKATTAIRDPKRSSASIRARSTPAPAAARSASPTATPGRSGS